MTRKQSQGKAEQKELRSLTGSAAVDVALAFAGGAGAATGKVVVDQIAQKVTSRPKNQESKIVLPSGHKKN